MRETTVHGDNIADQIQGEDAFGDSGELTMEDVWNIIDNLHTHFLDTGRDTVIFETWMEQIDNLGKG